MYWRRFAVSSIPLDDSKAFETWLRARWTEKDKLLDGYLRTGRFPADEGVDKTRGGKTRRGAGYIETEIKATHWYDFLQVFAPIGLFALVLYAFYGALPKRFSKSINKQAVLGTIEAAQKYRIKGLEKKLLMGSLPKAFSNELTALKKEAGYQIKGPEKKLLMGPVGPVAKAWGNEVTGLIKTAEYLIKGPEKKLLMVQAPKFSSTEVPGLKKAVTTLQTVTKDGTTQKALQVRFPTGTPVIKAATTQKPAIKNGTIRKAPLTGMTTPKRSVTCAPTQQARSNVAKQQQNSTAFRKQRVKQETSSTPKKLGAKREVDSRPKMPDVKPKPIPENLESTKLEAKHEASSISKKPSVKHQVSTAPKKLQPTKLSVKQQASPSPKKLEAKKPDVEHEARSAPKKLENSPDANSETSRASKKLEIRQKSAPLPNPKQNTRQAPKKRETRS